MSHLVYIVELAQVILTDENKHVFFRGVVYGEDGKFQFENIKIDVPKIFLEVSYTGYEIMKMSANRSDFGSEVDLGTIKLTRKANILESATVMASSTIRSVNKSTYGINNVWLKDADVSADIFRKIPELSVNELHRTISIKGKEKTLVLINGVNTGESADIRTIRPADIEKIEMELSI